MASPVHRQQQRVDQVVAVVKSGAKPPEVPAEHRVATPAIAAQDLKRVSRILEILSEILASDPVVVVTRCAFDSRIGRAQPARRMVRILTYCRSRPVSKEGPPTHSRRASLCFAPVGPAQLYDYAEVVEAFLILCPLWVGSRLGAHTAGTSYPLNGIPPHQYPSAGTGVLVSMSQS